MQETCVIYTSARKTVAIATARNVNLQDDYLAYEFYKCASMHPIAPLSFLPWPEGVSISLIRVYGKSALWKHRIKTHTPKVRAVFCTLARVYFRAINGNLRHRNSPPTRPSLYVAKLRYVWGG